MWSMERIMALKNFMSDLFYVQRTKKFETEYFSWESTFNFAVSFFTYVCVLYEILIFHLDLYSQQTSWSQLGEY